MKKFVSHHISEKSGIDKMFVLSDSVLNWSKRGINTSGMAAMEIINDCAKNMALIRPNKSVSRRLIEMLLEFYSSVEMVKYRDQQAHHLVSQHM